MIFGKQPIVGIPKGITYPMPIRGEFEYAEDWAEELDVLRNCHEGDTVHMMINGVGGSAAVMVEFLSCMHQCRGHVITELTGQACSAFGFILLAGDEIRVNKDVTFHAHTVQYGTVGNEHNVHEHTSYTRAHTHALLDKHYKHFFTQDEIDEMKKGSEKYLGYDEILERLQRRSNAILEEEMQEMQQDIEDMNTWSKERLLDFVINEDHDPDDWEDDEDNKPEQLELPLTVPDKVLKYTDSEGDEQEEHY